MERTITISIDEYEYLVKCRKRAESIRAAQNRYCERNREKLRAANHKNYLKRKERKNG